MQWISFEAKGTYRVSREYFVSILQIATHLSQNMNGLADDRKTEIKNPVQYVLPDCGRLEKCIHLYHFNCSKHQQQQHLWRSWGEVLYTEKDGWLDDNDIMMTLVF